MADDSYQYLADDSYRYLADDSYRYWLETGPKTLKMTPAPPNKGYIVAPIHTNTDTSQIVYTWLVPIPDIGGTL